MKAKSNIVSVDGIHFNKEWVASKSLKEFKKEADTNEWFKGDPQRDEKLNDVHKQCTAKEQAPETLTAPTPAPVTGPGN